MTTTGIIPHRTELRRLQRQLDRARYLVGDTPGPEGETDFGNSTDDITLERDLDDIRDLLRYLEEAAPK